MIGFVRGLILVLTSLAVAVGVVAIKRAAVWGVSDWSPASLTLLDLAVIGPAVLYLAWLHLLRPILLKRRLQREQRAEDAGVRELTVWDGTRD